MAQYVIWRFAWALLLFLAVAVAALGKPSPRPAAPAVSGPRDTTLERPVYVFRARGAIAFRCAFDTTALHRCARRYSQRLEPGQHVLRVRAVGRRGTMSRIVAVRIRVRLPVPELIVDWTTQVGPGAGVPAPDISGVWTPVTSDGTLARVRMTDGAILSRTAVGVAGSTEHLDSAVGDGRASTQRTIWSASDAGGRITRVDHRTGSTVAFATAPRPGGLTYTERAVWSFHFLQGTVTRIDLATMTPTAFGIPGARATGIAWGEGSLWLLTTQPAQVLQLDPETGSVRRRVDVRPPFPQRRSLIDTWSLAYADGAVWATLPNHRALARIDAVTGEVRYVRVPAGNPFGVSAGAGSVWVATDRAVLQLEPQTGSLRAGVLVPRATRTGFVSIAYGYGAAWFTNYDRGTLSRVRAPGTPP